MNTEIESGFGKCRPVFVIRMIGNNFNLSYIVALHVNSVNRVDTVTSAGHKIDGGVDQNQRRMTHPLK